jgi:hypothetical protein
MTGRWFGGVLLAPAASAFPKGLDALALGVL